MGIRMIPRGEVGLIFASNGAHSCWGSLVVTSSTYSAVVITLVTTTD